MKTRYLLALLWIILGVIGVLAQDEVTDSELPVIPYFQSYAFNTPVLEGWDSQSTDTIAQFYLPDAQATIRTNVVYETDSIVAAEADLTAFFEVELPEPVYSEKVNLADGTWAVLVYRLDDDTTASAMARVDGGRSYVVSFIEDNPDVEITMVTIAHGDDDQNDPTPEIAVALEALTDIDPADLDDPETMILSSGEWTRQTTDSLEAMGWVFGNDSYLAIVEGSIDNFSDIANAYNTALLGFFVTPDNTSYLILGLVVSLGTVALLLLSIWWRSRSLQQDLAVLQQLAEDD